MPRGDHLGEFELHVLAAALRLGDNAYGVPICDEIEARARRRASMGAVHAALGRLADKGYVTFRLSEPLPVRGGRSRKHVRVTAAGRRALAQASTAMLRMIEGLGLDAR